MAIARRRGDGLALEVLGGHDLPLVPDPHGQHVAREVEHDALDGGVLVGARRDQGADGREADVVLSGGELEDRVAGAVAPGDLDVEPFVREEPLVERDVVGRVEAVGHEVQDVADLLGRAPRGARARQEQGQRDDADTPDTEPMGHAHGPSSFARSVDTARRRHSRHAARGADRTSSRVPPGTARP